MFGAYPELTKAMRTDQPSLNHPLVRDKTWGLRPKMGDAGFADGLKRRRSFFFSDSKGAKHLPINQLSETFFAAHRPPDFIHLWKEWKIVEYTFHRTFALNKLGGHAVRQHAGHKNVPAPPVGHAQYKVRFFNSVGGFLAKLHRQRISIMKNVFFGCAAVFKNDFSDLKRAVRGRKATAFLRLCETARIVGVKICV